MRKFLLSVWNHSIDWLASMKQFLLNILMLIAFVICCVFGVTLMIEVVGQSFGLVLSLIALLVVMYTISYMWNKRVARLLNPILNKFLYPSCSPVIEHIVGECNTVLSRAEPEPSG